VLGRLTGIGASGSTTNFTSISNRGFILGSKQTTAGTDYAFGYSYWPSGALSTMTYPSHRQVSYTLDPAGRIQQVQNLGLASPYASNIQYTAHGAMKQLTLGNGVVETTNYSLDRLQPTSIVAANASSTFLSLTYNYGGSGGNNGNVQGQT